MNETPAFTSIRDRIKDQPNLYPTKHYNTNIAIAAKMGSAQLGSLARLPPELRLSVYENALSNGPAPALMRASRAIYNEIKPRLYDTIDIHVYPVLGDPFIRVSFRRLKNASWSFMEESDCFRDRGGLHDIPYNSFKNTRVNIYARDQKSLGQLAYLWVKIEDFVGILCTQRTLKNTRLELNLCPYKGHVWTTPQQQNLEELRASYLRDPLPPSQTRPNPFLIVPSPRWDTDFFWIPFARLYKKPNCQKQLSDGTAHNLKELIWSIQAFLGSAADVVQEREAEWLRSRVLTRRTLKYVQCGGPLPPSLTVPMMNAESEPECVAMYLPPVLKLLLGPKSVGKGGC